MIDSILADVLFSFYPLGMVKAPDLNTTICELLRDKAGDQPINLLEIGPTLVVEMGFSQEQIVNALFWLVSQKQIELMPHNQVRLLLVESKPSRVVHG
ncbi:hypothetical protein [Rhizobium sp. 2MFCol3.1]|uniref:hypothetical protein n=1 Tax=Rhizobium sp. 2MFCol3.1 TaxID=1246459 RepID=UPI0003726459|nr:hypothetical protein [Rhizobium sp. 2MFCol3.1]